MHTTVLGTKHLHIHTRDNNIFISAKKVILFELKEKKMFL